MKRVLVHSATTSCLFPEPSHPKMNRVYHKRGLLNLKEQRDAFISTMADTSMVFDGRDIVSYYKSRLRESEKARSEMISLCMVYKPKSVKGKTRHRSPPPEKSHHVDNSSRCDENKAPNKISVAGPNKPVDDVQAVRTFERQASNESSATTGTTDEDTLSSSKPTEMTSSRDLFRRKKSSPKHRCAEKNLNLKSLLKKPKYVPSKDLKCTLQLVRKDHDQPREKMVHFRGSVEVYCYKAS